MSPPIAQLWINGEPRSSNTNQTYDVINPGSQTVVGRAVCASSEDAVAAILAANAAYPTWEALSADAKRDIFLNAAQLVKTPKYAERILQVVTQETGAVREWGEGEVHAVVYNLLEGATTTTQLRGETMRSRMTGGTILIERRPFGAIFAISPFNAPVSLAARAIAIPMACGNTVVLKSSEFSPGCAEVLVELMHEAGIPKGVLNLLHVAKGDAPKIVAEIIGHKFIRHINFTGSHRIGRILAGEAAKHLKPCVFELGGKSAAVVLDDANIREAARAIIFGAMYHSGQICMSSERVIVQRSVSDALIKALTKLAQQIRSGTSPASHLSPLISTPSAQNVISLLTDAKSRGAAVLVGDLKHSGAVVQPHILLGVEPGWPVWEEETFGPVFGIKIVDGDEEAVELANMTDYSLMSAVWTRDLERGLRVARAIRTSQVVINGTTYAHEAGVGVHGLGGATGYGRFDIENFTQRRILVITPPGMKLPLVKDLN